MSKPDSGEWKPTQQKLSSMTIDQREAWVAGCSIEEKRILKRYPEVFLLDKQLAPETPFMYHWLCAARGVGKTLAALIWLWGKVRNGAEEVCIVAPTHKVLHQEILPVFFKIFPRPTAQNLNSGIIEINKSCLVKLYSTENEIRGMNAEFGICEEMTNWCDRNEDKIVEAWTIMNYGVRNKRAYPHPQIFNATTPRNYEFLKTWEGHGLLNDDPAWSFVRMTIDDAKFLSEPKRLQMIKEAGNSKRARQELYAEIVDEAPDALFTRDWINDHRLVDAQQANSKDNRLHLKSFGLLCQTQLPDSIYIRRGVISVDPAVTTGDSADETGIVLLFQDFKGDIYVVQDLSGKHTPAAWAKIVMQTFWHHKHFVYDMKIVAETNQGGDLVVSNLLAADHQLQPYIKQIKASKGKLLRAEPVAAKYERGKVHHIGYHELLERQMCNYNGDPAQNSPDRLDALVHGVNELTILPQPPKRDVSILSNY